MRLVILGPPGSGKGTQAKLLEDKMGIPAISVGALLRAEVEAGSEDGLNAQGYMEKGEWVPHDTTFRVLQKRLEKDDAKAGFVIDAFPRLSAEYHQLGAYLAENELELDAVINLKVSDLECLRRIQARSEVQASKGVYRPDASEEVTLNRLKIHHETSKPILEYYYDAGLLREVNGNMPIGMVHKEILKALSM